MRLFVLPKGSARQQPAQQTEGISLTHALLAQLVEQLTLNQRAQGSSPWKCTIKIKHEQGREQSTPASARFGKAQAGKRQPGGLPRSAFKAAALPRQSPWKCTIKAKHEQGREQSLWSCALKAPMQPALCKYLPQGSY